VQNNIGGKSMFGFMTYIEKDGGFIGGYLLTNNELSPIQFGHTSKISSPSKLEKILHGVQLESKWYGDLIAGTLYDGIKNIDAVNAKSIDAIFVSHGEMLHLKKKTGDIPVAYINQNGEIVTYKNHQRDAELVAPHLAEINQLSSLDEIFSRIRDGISECLST
jgi:hypothetical protein